MSSARRPSVTSATPNLPARCRSDSQPAVTSVPDCSACHRQSQLHRSAPRRSPRINTETNVITAEQPGTTVITASVAGGSSSAGYFSTCPPQVDQRHPGERQNSGTVTQGVTQNLTTTVLDTNGNPITGLTLDYQSTDPIDITAAAPEPSRPTFPAWLRSMPSASRPLAIRLPSIRSASTAPDCPFPPTRSTSPSRHRQRLRLVRGSRPVAVRRSGRVADRHGGLDGASAICAELDVMDRLGTNLYFGSPHELMVYSTASNAVTKQDTSVPGVVLAVSPNNSELLINDQVRQVFYLYTPRTPASFDFWRRGHRRLPGLPTRRRSTSPTARRSAQPATPTRSTSTT